jgi:hypothetical protein
MIALDLDNCIICYDRAFLAAAERSGCAPAKSAAVGKEAVKAAAFERGGNELWTRLQGEVYGTGIHEASFFAGCREFVDRALALGESLVILSHKTKYPALGPQVDLRAAAWKFLQDNDFPIGSHMPAHFCDTREEKVALLGELGCRAIVDDLPVIYRTPLFPTQTLFVLFDPSNAHAEWNATPRVGSWREASHLLLAS